MRYRREWNGFHMTRERFLDCWGGRARNKEKSKIFNKNSCPPSSFYSPSSYIAFSYRFTTLASSWKMSWLMNEEIWLISPQSYFRISLSFIFGHKMLGETDRTFSWVLLSIVLQYLILNRLVQPKPRKIWARFGREAKGKLFISSKNNARLLHLTPLLFKD